MRPAATACLACLGLVLGFAACGGGASDDQQVRDTVKRFGAATARKDYARICRDVLSKQLVARVRAVGLPCEDALAQGLGAVKSPRVTVRRVRVNGQTALAEVSTTAAGQAASRDVLRLVHEDGEWRIASLSGAQPPAPARTP